jgi:hypothetical protein
MTAAVAAIAARWAGPASWADSYPLAHRVLRAGYLLLAVQFAGFLAWSALLYHRAALSLDFATYAQPWYLIAHGNLDPYSTLAGLPFWQNDAEFMPWLLAPLYWLGHTDLLLSWAQDLSVAGAEAVALTWLCALARERCRDRDAALLTGLGLALLVLNPWIWWTICFDVHEEPFVIAFTVLLAWDLMRGRRRAWLWIPLVLAGGAPSATYVAGLGLGGVLAGRRSRRMGAAMVAVGVGYSLLLVLVHGDAGVPLARHFGYLATHGGPVPSNLSLGGLVTGVTSHPVGLVQVLWDKRIDILANLAPGGLAGVATPMLAPLMLVVLLANTLSATVEFAEPTFQTLPLYVLVPVGTVAILGWLLRRHRRTAWLAAGLLAAQALGWALVWAPRTSAQWLRVSAPAAAILDGVRASIPGTAEVIASQGEIGAFSDRVGVYALNGSGTLPVRPDTWIVVTPTEGIQTASPATSMALIGELAGPLHAALVAQGDGVWAFRWTPPAGTRTLLVPGASAPVPAWAAVGAAGQPVITGPVSGWHMAATGARGYVVDGIEWLEPPGRYRADVSMSAAAPVNVEVWDDADNTLLARRIIRPGGGLEHVVLPVAAPSAAGETVYSGWGPFRAQFVSPSAGQVLEVRVWSPGGGAVNVYSADLTAASGSALPLCGHLGCQEFSSGDGFPDGQGAGFSVAERDTGGERHALRTGARDAQGDVQPGAVNADRRASQRGRHWRRRSQVPPPAGLVLGGTAQQAEVFGQPRGLKPHRRAALPPGGRRGARDAQRAQRCVVLRQGQALIGQIRRRGHLGHRPVSRCNDCRMRCC